MKKKLLIIALCSIATHLYAYDFETNGIFYNIKSSKDLTAEVTNSSKFLMRAIL